MISAFFALAHSEFGVSHFTTDLILVISGGMLLALPFRLLRPHMHEREVKSQFNNNW